MLTILASIMIAIVALEHLYILVMEMFLWTTPRVMKTFGTNPEHAELTRSMAANQGLYNGFLAAGLIWSLLHPDATIAYQLALFFLACVIVAALYGGLSVKRSILLMQGLPAVIAFLLVLISH
ncbi:DUF1304 domain-containing protein [Paenibacillus hunanensis]|uniref:DUF1304 domain-containing protein n=1 Tax=Paenibacillus hunanensis TaxID=539262 RepID=UPI0020264A40|nr:DUF1304 domain-containing protein [Paenibacillus hunanensis]MCL9661607.1 DUF1304 domain-containing protein [Paenibacillus hunanensis]WPP41557.1 DUF1304 domain-containing protein [Paenibacillus hunanensis]